ncbi:MAG: amino acid adenylation domain-containing protein [Oscillibacter sp.]|nr:amino acid adenylation domain-containing protein [Oscillibacter sp.]
MRHHVLNDLRRVVREKPDKTAFSDGEHALTFRQLSDQSRAVGTALHDRGIYKRPVVVFMRKAPAEIAAFFGVITGGCFYVPIDEEMPAVRIQLILDNVRAPLVICDGDTAEAAKSFDLRGGELALYEELIQTEVDDAALETIYNRSIDTDPIYIVFTSGSTGIPKGVAACHRSVLDYIEQLSETLGFDENTVFGNQTPLYFDACLKELYPTLRYGATTYLIPKRLFSMPIQLVEYLNAHQINTICWVVSALTMVSALGAFDTVKPEYLRTVAFGSEVFPPRQLRAWRTACPGASFTNLYGPTEGTGMCCFYHVDRDIPDGEPIPIGQPFPNREILLLKEDSTLAGPGEEGELCIRGTSVTLGYYNDPDRTAAAYVQNPLNTAYPELIYKTGDIAKYNDAGELVFVSRRDSQIKHMGHRIELGEIEVNAAQFADLAACIYDTKKGRIVLYYTGSRTERDMARELKTALPRYMVPNRFTKLDTMPLTPNGKLDRMALKRIYEGK